MYPLGAFVGIGQAAGFIIPDAMLADIIDYDELLTGTRSEVWLGGPCVASGKCSARNEGNCKAVPPGLLLTSQHNFGGGGGGLPHPSPFQGLEVWPSWCQLHAKPQELSRCPSQVWRCTPQGGQIGKRSDTTIPRRGRGQ